MKLNPGVFISSTIYDFSDLRSAIKYYLESLNFDVYLSEYNDFVKDLNVNSYEACLKTIESCEYYILLIGSRVGGYYDEKNRISITQMEYRKAYEQLLKGKIKIVNIVREDIWMSRNERKKLKQILLSEYKIRYEISDDDIMKIKNFKSDISNNAEFTFNFINEVIRVKEMKNSISNNEMPIGNWIHSFKTFNDIVDILKVQFGFEKPLENLALMENLKFEVMENLKLFFMKEKNGILQKNIFMTEIMKKFDGDIKGETILSKEDSIQLSFFLVTGFGFSIRINTEFVNYALTSGKFLQFDKKTGRLKQSPFTIALLNLKKYYKDLQGLESIEQLNIENRLKIIDNLQKPRETYSISNILLFTLLNNSKLQDKIINLLYVIYVDLTLESDLLNNYEYDDSGPSDQIDRGMEKEKIEDLDLIKYLEKILKTSQTKSKK